MDHVCIWCFGRFTPRQEGARNTYSLPSSGTAICWKCSDLYVEAELEMHLACIKGHLEGPNIHTESGYTLPVQIKEWSSSRWRKNKARATDSFGNNWNVKVSGRSVALRPI